jgi:hypothetical protein
MLKEVKVWWSKVASLFLLAMALVSLAVTKDHNFSMLVVLVALAVKIDAKLDNLDELLQKNK